MSATNTNSPEALQKTFVRLETQFPWIWALRASWSFSRERSLPVVKVATNDVLSESIWRNKDWWVVCESRSDDQIVYEVLKLQSFATVEDELRRHLEDKRFVTTFLCLVSQEKVHGSGGCQSFVIYKPESGKSDLGYLLQ
jgi:hypothetical protein